MHLTTWARQRESLWRCIQKWDYLQALKINISKADWNRLLKPNLLYKLYMTACHESHAQTAKSMVWKNFIFTAYLWDAESLKEDSVAAWRSMTLDLRRWRRSCSSSLPGKAASSGVLQAAGDRPLFFKEDDVHPARTWETGVEAALILTGDEYTNTEAVCWHRSKLHLKENSSDQCLG